MKYAIIDQIKNGDQFDNIFDTEEEAIREADREWERMHPLDKESREYYCVMIGELDEYGCFDLDTAKYIKIYKQRENPYWF